MLNDSISSSKSVIGTVITHPELFDDLNTKIMLEDILNYDLKQVFKSIKEISAKGISLSRATVEGALPIDFENKEVVAECMSYSDSRSFEDNILIIKDASTKRQISEMCGQIQDNTSSGKSSSEILCELSSKVDGLIDQSTTGEENVKSFKDIMPQYITDFKEKVNNKSGVTGLSTGIDKLDEMTAGLQPADLVIVAARPSMGKTTAAMGFVETSAIAGNKVMVFSIEMPTEAIMQRSIASIGGIDQTNLRTGQLTELEQGKFHNAAMTVSKLPIIVDDSSSLTVAEMRLKALKEHKKSPLSMIMVDYLQLMSAADAGIDPGNKNLVVTHITRGLKMLAKELGVPVVALSQLNRSLEQRADKRPMNSDLRDSGSVEQDADLIIFIYRDEVYNEDSPDKGTAEFIIGKQRNGGLGMARTKFEGKFSRFKNLSKIQKIEPERKIVETPSSENYQPSMIPEAIQSTNDELPM